MSQLALREDQPQSPLQQSPHYVEQEVRRCLTHDFPEKICSLVVRRIDDGICLQGMIESADKASDACSMAESVPGVGRVINRLIVAPTN